MASFLVTIEKAPKAGCGGGLLLLIIIVCGIAIIAKKDGSSSRSYAYAPAQMGDQPSPFNGAQDPNSPQRAMLGVKMADIDQIPPATRTKLGLTDASGVVVTSAAPGSPADLAGIRQGDIILSINGRQVPTTNDVRTLVGMMAVGAKATVRVRRGGQQLDLVATLAAS